MLRGREDTKCASICCRDHHCISQGLRGPAHLPILLSHFFSVPYHLFHLNSQYACLPCLHLSLNPVITIIIPGEHTQFWAPYPLVSQSIWHNLLTVKYSHSYAPSTHLKLTWLVLKHVINLTNWKPRASSLFSHWPFILLTHFHRQRKAHFLPF